MIRRTGWVIVTLLSHWRRHPLQLGCLIVGLWLATALWSGVQALNQQARDSYDRAAQLFGGQAGQVLASADGQTFDQSRYVTLRRLGWPVSPVLQGSLAVSLAGQAGSVESVQLVGIDPLTLPPDSSLTRSSETADVTAFIVAPGQTWMAGDTLTRFGVRDGDVLMSAEGRRLPPVRRRDELPPGVAMVDIGRAQQLLGLPGHVSQLLVAEQFAAQQPAIPDTLALRWDRREEADLQRLTDSFHLNLTALALLAFLVGLFIVQAAAGLAMQQRRRLIQTLRACGASAGELLIALTFELVSLALIAGSLGMLTGYLLAGALVGDLVASLQGLYGAEVSAQLNASWSWWLSGLAMSLAGTLVATGGHALAALRQSLVPSRQAPGWMQAQRRMLRTLSTVSLVLLALAAGLWVAADGLVAGFALLGCILLAATLALPMLLAVLLGIGRRLARGPVSQWFWADGQQQLSRLSLALMALLLALAANIGVGGMTEGFRRTFTDWLDQRLAADVYVRPEGERQAQDILDWLQLRADVDDVLPSWQVDSSVDGWPTEISGVIEHPLYAQTWPLLEARADAWRRLQSGEGALVSEQLANRADLALGDTLELDTPAGAWSLELVGIYPDYGNPRGQALVAAREFLPRWPEVPVSSIGILGDSDPAALAQAIEAQFDVRRVADQASLKTYSSRVFEQTFAATAALSTLTLGVAALALFSTLLGLADTRLVQLAPLWAMGLRPAQLGLLSLAQLAVLAALTCLLAIPLGLVLSWCLVAVVNVQAFGWRLPWHWFPGQWLQLVGLAMVAVLLAASLPVARIARARPDNLLRQFVHEG
ncbi:putative ABC transport system permease protein [Halopseudomonas xinjiangensis]|uniref:Putative ABC transport system permease protein n=1 Tax=Halopseudomonas xinjiangensis TaxID=487184 RepID=A0A1H1Z183_9GAMM|nr:FtsX-like permease family protein [Halopseudomonas xinjiangensis]SDT26936.1 putative ABC transport system permease protein [Halopseudomonas xinjiangensis]